MSEKTPYSRSEESNSREVSMRKELAPRGIACRIELGE